MTTPITGPYSKHEHSTAYQMDKEWYRQKRPYDTVLHYYKQTGTLTRSAPGWTDASQGYALASVLELFPDCYNKAYAKLVGRLGDTAGLGINLAQYKQATSMISARGLQLLAFTSALIRRSPQGIARSLHISLGDVKKVLNRKYGVARTLSDLWLEFHFGWEPLVKDIYAACEVISDPLPNVRISGKGERNLTFKQDNTVPASTVLSYTKHMVVRLGADVAVENPNLRLLQQMGLANPADVIFDGIPWSFVFGWFHNLQDYLQSMTTFLGLKTLRGYRSIRQDVSWHGHWNNPPPWTIPYPGPYPTWIAAGEGTYKARIPVDVASLMPILKRRPHKDLSPVRALTSISLLVQKLPRT